MRGVRWRLLAVTIMLGVLAQYGLALIPALTWEYEGIGELNEPKEWPRRVPAEWPEVDFVGFHYIGVLWDQRFYETGPAFDRYAIWRLRTGFPMRSLVTDDIDEWHRDGYGEPSTNTPINQRTWWERGFRIRRDAWAVPIRPLWTGFVLDTLLAAASVYFAISGTLWAVRQFRRRRGCCECCGYQHRGLAPCPECGATIGATKA